jgi:3-isopropylmalate/(R)-2-methylmalate dehydratase small subunit
MARIIEGPVFVVGDNVDTDQIIPAEYLNLVPTIPEEYRRLGSHAFAGLPDGFPPFITDGDRTRYRVVVAARNFGCGSSREHAPVALGAAGVEAVVAESYARIFFRNCVATGELYPIETTVRLPGEFQTGDVAVVDLERGTIRNGRTGKEFPVKPLGEAGPVIDAGGLFNYARQTGMIRAEPAAGAPAAAGADDHSSAGPHD